MIDLMIITGASRGIGRYIAGLDIAKNSLLISSSRELDSAGSAFRGNKFALRLNIDDFENVISSISAYAGNLGNIRSIGVALCAAQLGDYGGLFSSDLGRWEMLYRTNVLGNLSVIKSLEPYLRAGCKLRAVFFAGGGAAYAYPEFSGYALTKVAVVRAVENLGMEFSQEGFDASIVALAPGAVATDMLAKVLSHGGTVKTRTEIQEPAGFVHRFVSGMYDSAGLNGRFIHVRDDLADTNGVSLNSNLYKLRRIE